MANKVAKIVKLEAKKYNKTRKILKPVGVTLKLQTKDGDYDSFREKIRVKVAKYNDSTFESNLLLASDALIGSDRYEIDKRDITVPDADRPYWRFYCIMNQENY
jgi:hypothetical protein